MKSLTFTTFMLWAIFALHLDTQGQNDASRNVRANNILTRIGQQNNRFSPTDMIVLMPPEYKDEMEGNPYWDEHWGSSSVLLYKSAQPHEGYLTRYDLLRNEFEFNIDGQIKVVRGSLVQNIVWIDSVLQVPRYLVNAREYRFEGIPLNGFLEVLVDGENSLFKKVSLQLLKPNYNLALSVGSKNTRIVKMEVFYYSVSNDVFEIKSRKNFYPLFGTERAQMDMFIKKERIKFNNQKDLVKLFAYFLKVKSQK